MDERWQTNARKLVAKVAKKHNTLKRGTNNVKFIPKDEYQIYLDCADDGEGIDITTGKPLKTYEEWLVLWHKLDEFFKEN